MNLNFHDGVRLKGSGKLAEWPQTGIKYLELRMLDLDPGVAVGIKTNTLRFIRLLASYFVMSTPLRKSEVDAVLVRARKINSEVAAERPDQISKYQEEAQAFLERLNLYANRVQLGPEYQEELQMAFEKVANPLLTPSAKMMQHIKAGSLHDYALERAKWYQNAALQALRPYTGFAKKEILTAQDLKTQLFSGNWDLTEKKL